MRVFIRVKSEVIGKSGVNERLKSFFNILLLQ